MLVVLTPRVEIIPTPVGHIANLYVVPKVIKDERQIKNMIKSEFKSCPSNIEHLTPMLVGNYNISRPQLSVLIKKDAIIGDIFHTIVVKHFSYSNVKLEDCSDLSKDILLRLQLILKRYEMNNMIGWNSEIAKYLAVKKGLCRLKSLSSIYEDKIDD